MPVQTGSPEESARGAARNPWQCRTVARSCMAVSVMCNEAKGEKAL
jgi:hypothetical protein